MIELHGEVRLLATTRREECALARAAGRTAQPRQRRASRLSREMHAKLEEYLELRRLGFEAQKRAERTNDDLLAAVQRQLTDRKIFVAFASRVD